SVLVLAGDVRRWLARVIPIDPRSPVHAIALSLVTAGTVMLLGQLIAQRGRPPLLAMIEADPSFAKGPGFGPLAMLFGLIWIVPACLILVGWPVVRSWRRALERLGLVRPTLRQVAGAVGLALALVAASYAFDFGIGW